MEEAFWPRVAGGSRYDDKLVRPLSSSEGQVSAAS